MGYPFPVWNVNDPNLGYNTVFGGSAYLTNGSPFACFGIGYNANVSGNRSGFFGNDINLNGKSRALVFGNNVTATRDYYIDFAYDVIGRSNIIANGIYVGNGSRLTNLPAVSEFFAVIEGDSISEKDVGVGRTNWPYQMIPCDRWSGQFTNRATGGWTTANVSNDLATALSIGDALAGSRTKLLCVMAGANDIWSGAGYLTNTIPFANLTNIWARGRAAGYKVLAFTVPYNGGAGLSGTNYDNWLTLNRNIAAATNLWDYLARPDIAIPYVAENYLDAVHPSPEGSRKLAIEVGNVLSRRASIRQDSELDRKTWFNGSVRVEMTTNGLFAVGKEGFTTAPYFSISNGIVGLGELPTAGYQLKGSGLWYNGSTVQSGTAMTSPVFRTASGASMDIGNNVSTQIYLRPTGSVWSAGSLILTNATPGKSDITTTNGTVTAATVVATSGFVIDSNAVANWPASPPKPGASMILSSNGFPFMLLSTGSAWSATNKFGW